GAAVVVDDHRDLSALLGLHVDGEQHEAAVPVVGEPLALATGEDRRPERPPRLPRLDRVEPGLEIVAARIGEDAAAAERPRTELHRPLKPADDLAGREQLGGLGPDVAEPL